MVRIKNKLLIILAFFCTLNLGAKDQLSEEQLFDLARKQLAQRDIENALLSLRRLYTYDKSNANVNFLMGAAYTELTASSDKAIYHLKKAIKNVSQNYKVGDYNEKKSPVHAYYYMTVALSARDECAKAAAANAKLKNYKGMIDLYFIDEADRHMQKCPYEAMDKTFEAWLAQNELPEGYQPELTSESFGSMEKDSILDLYQKEDPPLANLDSSRKVELGVVTRELRYSTYAPLYGVQIGSSTKPSPISTYSKLKNVDVFVDKEGIIRYVVGHFSYKKQAESLMQKLKEEGYEDAFVVNVNNERKYSNELISYNNVNLRAGIKGEVQYYIQLGAFRDTVPEHLMSLYLTVDDIKELNYNEMTLITVGSFETYKECQERKQAIIADKPSELHDAFIVAFNKGKKINLQEAKDYTD